MYTNRQINEWQTLKIALMAYKVIVILWIVRRALGMKSFGSTFYLRINYKGMK